MPDAPKTWSKTQLWKLLTKRAKSPRTDREAASALLPQVEQWMKKIEPILAQAQTAPLDFTLHDHEHSFRVAERMMELIRPAHWQHLSDYEVALLLLAAYLHDIGMSPRRKQVGAIHRHLLTREKDALTGEEAAALQRWLDESGYDLEPPICKAAPTPPDLDLADEITTYYVRHQHNDWSKEWIEQNLTGDFHFLEDWKDVLIRLCQSHHWDFRRLRREDLEPRPIGSQHPQRLHLRHLACLLRVADILENDPERVPPVVFQHRNIDTRPKSIVHWEIPHDLKLIIKGDRVFLSALPRQARHHKAILSLADAIDCELAGCAALAKDNAFAYCTGLKQVKRDWFLVPACHRDIRPRDGAYDYIDGAFRPNTAKLLQLLSGTQLYDTPLAAVRELLQNAFDAVREKIARHRLRQPNPADPKWENELGRLEHVTLTLDRAPGGGLRLTCHDTGCGMTRDIIQHYLLVSGEARRPALLELERDCKKAGFSLGRTGQFGIGVLSYFMMAAHVRLTTCRLQECGDERAPGWTFSTTGVGDFGELRRLPAMPVAGPGTTLEWHLDRQKFSDAEKLCAELEKYLRDQLIRIPCTFRFRSELEGKEAVHLDLAPGWARSHDDIRAAVTKDWHEVEDDRSEGNITASAEELAERREYLQRLPGWMEEARASLRFAEKVVPLPGDAGLLRVVLPWFDLPEGPALAYIFRDRQMGGRTFGWHEVLWAEGARGSAWKGMASAVRARQEEGGKQVELFPGQDTVLGWIECDFTHIPGSRLQVNRASLEIEPDLAQRCREITAKVLEELAENLPSRGPQPPLFGMLTDGLLERTMRVLPGCGVFQREATGRYFAAISLPCAMTRFGFDQVADLHWRGQPVCQPLGIGSGLPRQLDLSISARPQCVVALTRRSRGDDHAPRPAGLCFSAEPPPPDDDSVPFPGEWQDVWGCDGVVNRWLHNPAHWAVRLLQRERPGSSITDLLDEAPGLGQAAAISDPAEAALTLLNASKSLGEDTWKNLQTQQPGLLARLWQLCAQATGQPLSALRLICYDSPSWKLLTHDSCESGGWDGGNPSFLPRVTDPEWMLVEEEEAPEE